MSAGVVLRGLRVIDAHASLDSWPCDVWLRDGRIAALEPRLDVEAARVVDLRRPRRDDACVLCPGFIDLHAHLREPGDADAETVHSGAQAAAAGGFSTVLAMANTRPPLDSPAAVAAACERNRGAAVRVLQAAAVSAGLRGRELVDVEGCVHAGAVALSDDGRNAVQHDVLVSALRRAAACGLPVLVHPEDEAMIAARNPAGSAVTRCAVRPAEAEVSAVAAALRALRAAGRGHLHLQHVSTAGAVELLRREREAGLAVSAEVTPHHLGLRAEASDDPLRVVNPPLRDERDREAVRAALREGVIDAVATDHAPHTPAAKRSGNGRAAPGMIGLETALAACLSSAGDAADVALLVRRLTLGPWSVLGHGAGIDVPTLRVGEPATCVLFDPVARWRVTAEALRSRSSNTPLLSSELRGRVLLTMVAGRMVHEDALRSPLARPEPARV